MCDVSKLQAGLIGWNDPYAGYDSHNVLSDLAKTSDEAEKPIFSKVVYWQRPQSKAEEVEEEENYAARESFSSHLFPFLT